MSDALRVVVATWDGAGNNPPIVSLARALVARGDDVHAVGHESTRARFEAVGCSYVPWSDPSTPESIAGYMPPEEEWPYAEENIFFRRSYQTDLAPVIEELAPDVLLTDLSLRYAMLEGLRVGLPVVGLSHMLYGAEVGYPEAASPWFRALSEAAQEQGVARFSSRREMLDLADRVLVFTYDDFDNVSGDNAGANVLHVGPLRSPRRTRSDWVRRFPDRPLVVIGLSTSDQDQGALLQRLCDACATLDVEALVTTGPAMTAERLRTAENVTAIDFVSHDEVLPDARLLVTHAGHGTVAAGLTYGVPMLCTPLGRDQPFNAARVEALRVGATIDATSSTDALRESMRELLDDHEIVKRARDLSRSLRDHPGLDAAVAAIDATAARRNQDRRADPTLPR